MSKKIDPIDEILSSAGISEPWETMPATGLANRIYATKDVVIRISKDHEEALLDAKTESVAAPVVYDTGVLTPKLILFDDSGKIAEGPYSIWERVHAETLGLFTSDHSAMPKTWRQVGQQMAFTHLNVKPFKDPNNDLHKPRRNLDLNSQLEIIRINTKLDSDGTKQIEALIKELEAAVLEDSKNCFLHGDVKDMNIMCSADDNLVALIDWGDSGWGDPTFDFFRLPLQVIPTVLEGYREIAPNLLGDTLIERLVWDKLSNLLEDFNEEPLNKNPLEELRQFLTTAK